jgi:hypothetical protein
MKELVIKNTRGMEIPVSNIWTQDLALSRLAGKAASQMAARKREDIKKWAELLAGQLSQLSD